MWKRIMMVAMVAGCAEPAAVSRTAQAITDLCDSDYGCALNAASKSFELDLGPLHQPNGSGFYVHQTIPPPSYPGMTLTIEDDLDRLVGRLPSGAFVQNNQLLGTTLVLRNIDRPGVEHEIRLKKIDRFSFLVAGALGAVQSYLFTIDNGECDDDVCVQHLCPKNDHKTTSGEESHAIAFRGDRYDIDTTAISLPPSAARWINIACAGTAVAKLHLLRHTTAGTLTTDQIPVGYTPGPDEHLPYVTTVAERQAMLRALRADYCGDGTSYTVDGTPLRYADHKSWHPDSIDMADPSDRARVEAVWTAQGARCLEDLRLPSMGPVACPKPVCRADLTGWPALGHVITVTKPAMSLPGGPGDQPAAP